MGVEDAGGSMEESACSAWLSDLLCSEDGASLDGGEEGGDGVALVDDSAQSEMEDEYIGRLVSRETSFESSGSGCFSSGVSAGDWLKSARSGAVRWMLKTRALFGFAPRTAYLSVAYLDRFFLRRTIEPGQSWAIQLLSVACLSLAAKMEECRVPVLTEYPAEGYQFDNKAIQRMELLVLNTLEWRMSFVTPFLYLNYFASKLGGELDGKAMFYKAIGFIFSTIEGLNSADYRPSAIAAAAVFAASGQSLTRRFLEDKTAVLCTCGSLEIDHILSCYNVMIEESRKSQREQQPRKFSALSNTKSPASTMHSSGNAIGDPPLSSISCKRRRLTLSSYSCNSRISNMAHSD